MKGNTADTVISYLQEHVNKYVMIRTIVKVCMRYRGIIDYLGDGPAKALRGSSIWVSLKNEKFTENL